MGRYIARRCLQAVLTLFLVVFALHLLTTLAIQLNGNPALAFFGDRIPSASQLAAARWPTTLASRKKPARTTGRNPSRNSKELNSIRLPTRKSAYPLI